MFADALLTAKRVKRDEIILKCQVKNITEKFQRLIQE